MEGLVKHGPQFVTEQGDKNLRIFLIHQAVVEHTEALVDPQSCHALLGVVKIFVRS